MQSDPIDIPHELREIVRSSRPVLVLTGAGVSAESGIGTFRGPGAFWGKYNPMDVASPEGFARDPKAVWEWYLERREQIRHAEPNPGHVALAQYQDQVEARGGEFLLATQNIDRLHQRAGSRDVAELHGSIWRTRCTRTGQEYDDSEVTIEDGPIPPLSPHGAMLRPAVVWFGEYLPEDVVMRVEEFVMNWPPDLVILAGTTAMFPYIIRWPLQAQSRDAILVEVNISTTELSGEADFCVHAPSGRALPALLGA